MSKAPQEADHQQRGEPGRSKQRRARGSACRWLEVPEDPPEGRFDRIEGEHRDEAARCEDGPSEDDIDHGSTPIAPVRVVSPYRCPAKMT